MAEAMAVDLTLQDLSLVRNETFEARTRWYDIGLELGVHVDELDQIKKDNSETDVCHREMLKRWLKRAELKLTWTSLVKALSSKVVAESALAQQLRQIYCMPSGAHQVKLISELRDSLTSLQRIPSSPAKADTALQFIQRYISSSFQIGASLKYIEEQLQKLHKEDMLISDDLYDKACKKAYELHTEMRPIPISLSSSAHQEKLASEKAHECHVEMRPDQSGIKTDSKSVVSEAVKPLFNKDTVYHAGICSLAVNTCDAGNYQQFFKSKEKVPGHSFTEVSLSQSKQDRYIIARQDSSTLYFGFQSEPQLLQWSKQFKSFSEGFSFGGLLACAVAARVWDLLYIPTDLLMQNLVCITFGQPHVAIAMLEKVVSNKRPELASTIHSFYCEDDPVPRLMRFLDESLSQDSISEGRERKLHLLEHMKAPFQDPITSEILDDMTMLQLFSAEVPMSSESVSVLSKLMSKLEKATSKLDPTSRSTKQLRQCTTSYLISTLPTKLTCTRLSREQAGLQSNLLQQTEIKRLSVELLTQHSVLNYIQNKMFYGFLEKEPNKYIVPGTPTRAPVGLPDLKPSVKSVELRYHGNETAVVIEGRNFWFCYQVTFHGQSMTIPLQSVEASSIHFNIPQKKTAIAVVNKKVEVSLQSHFSGQLRRMY